MERRLWGIPGVEYLYSMSRPGMALITVRFKVNEPQEPSLVKIYQELAANPQLLPPGAMKPIIKLQTIDDVPFLVLTLHGEGTVPPRHRASSARSVMCWPGNWPTCPARPRWRSSAGQGGWCASNRIRTASGLSTCPSASFNPPSRPPRPSCPQVPWWITASARNLRPRDSCSRPPSCDRLVVGIRNQKPIYLADVARVVDAPELEPPAVLFAEASRPGFEPAVTRHPF